MNWITEAELMDVRGGHHHVSTVCAGDSPDAARVTLRRLAPALGLSVTACSVGFRAPETVLPFGTRMVSSYGAQCRLIADTGRGDAWVSYGAGGVTGLFVKAMRCELRTLDEIHGEALTYYGGLLLQAHDTDPMDPAFHSLAPRT